MTHELADFQANELMIDMIDPSGFPTVASSFRSFMSQVNSILVWRIGVAAQDLPDYLWRDCYDDGLSPEEAVDDFLDDNAADFEFR